MTNKCSKLALGGLLGIRLKWVSTLIDLIFARKLKKRAICEIKITRKPTSYSKKLNSNENGEITGDQEQYLTIF